MDHEPFTTKTEMKKEINTKLILAVSVILLAFTNAVTYFLFLAKNSEYKAAIGDSEKQLMAIPSIVDAMFQHVYYDGDSIQSTLTAKHYNRSGRLLAEVKTGELLKDEKVVLFLSTNTCSACAEGEINQIQDLSEKIGKDKVVVIADFPLHEQREWSLRFDGSGYYEIAKEHLGLKGSPSGETPVVRLTENGRIKTSFVVGQQTSAFAKEFHEYLSDHFKAAK